MGVFRLTLVIMSFLVCSSLNAQQSSPEFVPGEIIVKLKSQPGGQPNYTFMGKAHSEKGMNLKRSWNRINVHHFALKAGKTVNQTIDDLKNDPDVEYAEPNYIINKHAPLSINDDAQRFSAEQMESMSKGGDYMATGANIEASSIWGSLSSGPSKPIVAVIDTGLDVYHPVFTSSNAIWRNQGEIPGNGLDDDGNGFVDDVNGWNFVSNSGAMLDDDGHGTHVAGIILGVGQNIFSGPYSDSKIAIMPLKFLDSNGVGKTSDAIQAIYYAVNNGAYVLNNSWGGPGYSAALHEAIAYTYSQGSIFVAAAGNSASNNDMMPMYPASYNVPNIVSVAATTDSDVLAYFSNFGGSSVHLGSPGQYILSTWPGGGYSSLSGTSMAAPFVAGVAALMKNESPAMNGYQMKNIILGEVDFVGSLSGKVHTNGRVNVSSSVATAKSAVVDPAMPAYALTNADRELASALSNAGGCGTVTKMYADFNKSGRGNGPRAPGGGLSSWYIILLFGVFFIPVAIANHLKRRAPINQRRHERFSINTGVKMNIGGRELSGQVSCISKGGAQINTEALLEQGGIITMQITSPDGTEQIEVEGHVVWSEEKKAYGVQFANAKEAAISSIEDWTKSLTKAS